MQSELQRKLAEIAPMLDAIGEPGMAQDARDLSTGHTGLAATWCPACGNCTCKWLDAEEHTLSDIDCPLHGVESMHNPAVNEV